MTTARNGPTNVLIVDMSTMRFQWNPDHTACSALTARGELVAVIEVVDPDADPGEIAYALLDAALDRGQVLRPDPSDPGNPGARVSYRVALYNPFSAEISLGAVPNTVTFTDHEPVSLETDGLPAVAVAGRDPHLTLPNGRVLYPRELSFAGLTRLQIAHQAA